jgi:hypothetical protein
MPRSVRRVRALLCRRDGSALVEFAIALPVLLFIFLGIVEVSRFLLFRDKFQSSASQILDIINQGANVNKTSLDNLYSALPDMMKPYTGGDAQIIVTQIIKPLPPTPDQACAPIAAWQYTAGGSKVASNAGDIAKTGDIAMVNGDNVMVIEIFVNYTPFFDNEFSKSFLGGFQRMYTATYAHVRYGSFNIDPVSGTVVNVPCKAG